MIVLGTEATFFQMIGKLFLAYKGTGKDIPCMDGWMDGWVGGCTLLTNFVSILHSADKEVTGFMGSGIILLNS